MVFGDVAGGVAPDEGEVRTGLEDDGTDEEIAQGGIGAARFAEREFHEAAVAHGGAEKSEKTFAGSVSRIHAAGM
jgi:hypothetical protein